MNVYIVLRRRADVTIVGQVFKDLDEAAAWCAECCEQVLLWENPSPSGTGLQAWTAKFGECEWIIERRWLV